MTKWTIDELAYAKGTSEPVRQALLAMHEKLNALEQPAEPVALIRDGVLRWHIPHEHYSRPAWTAHGTHMLYAQPQPPRKPLTDEDIEQAQREVWRSLPSDFDYTTSSWIELGIRYAEAAHGIGETP